jgi:hypothetical protein
MSRSKKSRATKESELEVVKERVGLQSSKIQQTANIQNNFHFTNDIDLNKVTELTKVSLELATKYMELCERRQTQAENIDSFIMSTETKEQDLRITEKPYQREYAFRSLNYALLISLSSLIFAGYCAYLGHTNLAIVGITIPITIAVANILGFKSVSQEKTTKDDKEAKSKK